MTSQCSSPVPFDSRKAEDISRENPNEEEESKGADIEVKGSLSTKMEAVVRTLLRVEREEPKAKSLVFSAWPDVLDIVASGLQENGIQHAALHAQGKFKRNLQKFKVLSVAFLVGLKWLGSLQGETSTGMQQCHFPETCSLRYLTNSFEVILSPGRWRKHIFFSFLSTTIRRVSAGSRSFSSFTYLNTFLTISSLVSVLVPVIWYKAASHLGSRPPVFLPAPSVLSSEESSERDFFFFFVLFLSFLAVILFAIAVLLMRTNVLLRGVLEFGSYVPRNIYLCSSFRIATT